MKVIKSRENRIKRLRVISGILGFLILIFILIQVNMVNAGSQDSILIKNRKEGVYAVTILNGVNRLFYLNMYTMNGIPAYCIEIGVDISTDIYDSSTSYSGLSSVKQEYVKAVSYFGYKYRNHDDYRYYMASQEIIWEYLNDIDVSWTSVEDFNGDKINIDSYKDEIIGLVNSYYNNINLDGIGNDIVYGKEYVIEDRNGVISNYYVNNKSGIDVMIDGNTVKYKLIDKNANVVSFRLKWNNYYNYNSKFYTSGNSQKLISAGNFINKVYDASFNVVRATLNICVVDMDTKLNIGQGQAVLEGAIYDIYKDNGVVGTITTSGDGCGSIGNLDEGDYYIKQVSASSGYNINDDIVEVSLINGDNSIIVEEKVISNSIRFIKYLEDGVLESGILFSIFDWNGNRYMDVITDDNGVVVFDLVYGEYSVRQNNTTYGYNMVNDFVILVDKDVNTVREYVLNDDKIYGSLKINTRDSKSLDKILSDCFSYKIFDRDNNTYIDIDGYDIFNTDYNGEVDVNIGYGNYYLEEVDVCHGYVLNGDKVKFSVDDENTNVELDFFNDKIVGRINVYVSKEVFVTGDNEFRYDKIYLDDVIVSIYKDDILVDSVFINDNGKGSIGNLEFGNYCIIYDSFKECVVIDTDRNDVSEIVEEVNILVSSSKGDVRLNVMDNYGSYIDDVVVNLLDSNNNLIYTGSSSEGGTVIVKGLVVGDYCFALKKVPYGYDLNRDKRCFEIKDNDTSIVNVIINRKVMKSIIVPDTYFDINNYIKLFVMFIVLVVGGIYYKYKSS